MNVTETFSTKIFTDFHVQWVESLINITNPIIENLKKNNKLIIYHSDSITHLLPKEFLNLVINKSFLFFENQGYCLKNFKLIIRECWVQEFDESGFGHHEGHIHWNNHVSGFYFLKCSPESSYPIFHDPRPSKMMMQLPEKNVNEFTNASYMLNIKPVPGLMVLFPAFLEHQFAIDVNKAPFRFIHFNGQFLEEEICK